METLETAVTILIFVGLVLIIFTRGKVFARLTNYLAKKIAEAISQAVADAKKFVLKYAIIPIVPTVYMAINSPGIGSGQLFLTYGGIMVLLMFIY